MGNADLLLNNVSCHIIYCLNLMMHYIVCSFRNIPGIEFQNKQQCFNLIYETLSTLKVIVPMVVV